MSRSALLALFAAAALAGCNKSAPTADAEAEATANAAAAPVVLPPSISASKIYRCKDNSLVYIDWLSDGKSANFRASDGDSPIHLSAMEPGQPLVADGYSLTGEPAASSITLARPDKSTQSCHI